MFAAVFICPHIHTSRVTIIITKQKVELIRKIKLSIKAIHVLCDLDEDLGHLATLLRASQDLCFCCSYPIS